MIKETQLVKMGDALGVRIPETLVDKYGLQDEVVLEERDEGLLIHARREARLSWAETYRQMAAAEEDWSDWLNLHDEDEL